MIYKKVIIGRGYKATADETTLAKLGPGYDCVSVNT